MTLGQQLPQGGAKALYDRFQLFKEELPEGTKLLFPNAVCFTVSELQEYLNNMQDMFEERGIPESERCIALMPGKYGDDAPKDHLLNQMTVLLLASRVEANEETGQVTNIQNCVIKEGEFSEPGEPVDDLSYNIGSLHP